MDSPLAFVRLSNFLMAALCFALALGLGYLARQWRSARQESSELRREVVAADAALLDVTARTRAESMARQQAEAALRVSEARFQALFGTRAVGIGELALCGRWLRVNAALCSLTGYSQPELIERSFPDILPASEREGGWSRVRFRLDEQPERFPMQLPCERKDGTTLWIAVTLSLTRGASGEPHYFTCFIEDITARKRAEEALREGTTRLRTLADALPTLVFAADASGRSTFANARFLSYTGSASEALLGEGWLQAIHPADREASRARWQHAVEHGVSYEAEFRVRRHDGAYRWHLGRGEPLRDGSGAIVNWIGTATDIEEHKRDEEALQDRELRMRLALQASGAATWVVDYTQDSAEHFDAQSCALAGLEIAQQRWPGGTFCGLIHPEDRPRMQTLFHETVEAVGPGRMIEYRILTPQGETRWLQGAGIVQRDGAGRIRQFIGVAIDITERKRLESELRDTIEKLALADRRKDEFLATLAHELRNPLAPIRNGVQIIKLTTCGDAPLERTTEMMERQISHLVRLVDDLLDLSRITRGKVQLRTGPVALKEVLNGVLESTWTADESKRLKLSVDMTDESLSVEGDRDRLTQVFWNVLSNAAKYTGAGGEIWVSLRREGEQAVIRVRDTGIGIPAEALDSVFEMFSQVRPSGHGEGGLGIGLALVRQLVQMHGGRVEVRSEGLGRGSEFTVRLPALGPAPALMAFPATRPAWEAPLSTRRVLVVDDNLDSAQSLTVLLQLLGHEVRQASDGAAAVELALAFEPDVVFMDIGMPTMNGLEASRRIRELPLARQPLIVALTGWGQASDHERSLRAGIDHHLVKPIDFDSLRTLLAREELAN